MKNPNFRDSLFSKESQEIPDTKSFCRSLVRRHENLFILIKRINIFLTKIFNFYTENYDLPGLMAPLLEVFSREKMSFSKARVIKRGRKKLKFHRAYHTKKRVH